MLRDLGNNFEDNATTKEHASNPAASAVAQSRCTCKSQDQWSAGGRLVSLTDERQMR